MTPTLIGKPSKRQHTHAARARAIITDLLDSLGATTSYAQREPRRREKLPWRALYGWQLAFTAKKGCVINEAGEPTQVELVKKFSAEPGDIITTAGASRTGGERQRYIVREDRSLRKI